MSEALAFGLANLETRSVEQLTEMLQEAARQYVAAESETARLNESLQPARDALKLAQEEYERRVAAPLAEISRLGAERIHLSRTAARLRCRLDEVRYEEHQLCAFEQGSGTETQWRGHRLLWLGWSVCVFRGPRLVGAFERGYWRVRLLDARLAHACVAATEAWLANKLPTIVVERLRQESEVGQEVRAVRSAFGGLAPSERVRFFGDKRFALTVIHGALQRHARKIENARWKRALVVLRDESKDGCLSRWGVPRRELVELCHCGRPTYVNRKNEAFAECEICVAERVLGPIPGGAKTQTAPT